MIYAPLKIFHFVFLLILPTRPVGVDLLGAQVHGDDVLGGSGDFLLQALYHLISITLQDTARKE